MRLKLVFALFAMALLPAAFAQITPPKFVAGQVIVKFKPSTPITTMQSVHSRVGSQILKENATLKFQTVKLRTGYSIASAVSYYKSSPYVLYAHGNAIHKVQADVNDPLRGQQGSLNRMSVYQGWDLQTGLASVKVAVIDTGIDMTHPDLVSKIVDPYDQAEGDNFPQDTIGHGTHVAGLAAAATNNGIGVAGVGYKAMVMPIRFDFTVSGSAESIVRATIRGAKVINMSYGGGFGFQAEQEAIDFAWSKGVVLVAAAGNDNDEGSLYPAAFPNVISVAATMTNSDNRAIFSNYGPTVDVAAPGDGSANFEGVLSTLPGGTYGKYAGTSMASPNVAGVVALMWSRAYGTVPNTVIRAALEQYTDPLPVPGLVQFGRVNAFKAITNTPSFIVTTVSTAPVFLSVIEGAATNSTSRVLADDSVYFGIQSAPLSTVGQVASSSFRFTVPVPIADVQSLKFVVNSRFATGATGQIFLLNVATSKWEIAKSYPVGGADVTASAIIKTDRFKYTNADGEVRVLVRGVLPTAFVSGAVSTYNVDFVNMETTYVVEG